MKQYRNYIDGRFVESARRFDDIDPACGRVIAQVHEADRAMVDAAIAAGRRAADGTWGELPAAERAAMLCRVADEIERRFDDFLAAELGDAGKPVTLASTLDILRGAANFRVFADILKTAPLESFRIDLPGGAHAINYTVRKPLGVVGVISPWNLPLLLLTWKVAPAMACGNAVVCKPSEETPGTATLLAARDEGAQILVGGGVPRFGDERDQGLWVEPTVIAGLPDTALGSCGTCARRSAAAASQASAAKAACTR